MTLPEKPVPVPPDPASDHPDIERVAYPDPEVGTTQNDDAQSSPPPDGHDYDYEQS